MKIVRKNKQTLILEERYPRILCLLIALLVAFTAYTIYLMIQPDTGMQHYLPWSFLGFSMAHLIGEYSANSQFLFDQNKKTLSWRRKPLIGTIQEGELPFASIEEVRISTKGAQYMLRYRIELLVEGQVFPINKTYLRGVGVRKSRMDASELMVNILGLKPKK